mgnify:CR=1 FL=1
MTLKINETILKSKRWVPPTGRQKFLKFDLNENYSLFDDKFLKKLKNFDNFVINCYPEYDKIISLLSEYTKLPENNIAITNGGDQAIDLLLRLFFNSKSRILMPSPVFSIYDHAFSILGCKVKHIPYIDNNNYFDFPAEEILKSLDACDGIILCNPNNPLGSAIDEKILLKIIQKTNKLNIPCVIDEAYYEFYGKTSTDLIKKYKNIIIIRTFSKMFGLAGLRLGYVLANENIINELLKIRGPWDINHFAVFSGEVALKNIDYFSKKLKTFLILKKELEKFLIKRDIKFYKTETNFLVLKTKDKQEFVKKLNKSKILVNDISDYPFNFKLLKNSIRITVPNNKKDLKTLKSIF